MIKAVAATAALKIADKPDYAFTFNLTQKAQAGMAGFTFQGAFAADPEQHQTLKGIMWKAQGKWPGVGIQFQIWISPKLCGDRWATYSMRNQRRDAKINGPRNFNIDHPLHREALWTYTEVRRVMRASAMSPDAEVIG